MKAPISLLTFSSLSVSSCLLSQHLSKQGAESFFAAVSSGSFRWAALFYGFSRLASLFFGMFLYFRNTENRAEGDTGNAIYYFSVFSLVLSFIIPVLVFSHGAYIIAAVFSAILAFFIILLLFSTPSQKACVLLFCVPMLAFSVVMAAFSVGGVLLGW